jgi:thioredoxin-like negative regulator of GroEL
MGKLSLDLRNSEQENLFHFYSKNAKICVVDFYADWCGPCKRLSAQLDESLPSQDNIISHVYVTSDQNKMPNQNEIRDKIVILKINIDNFESLAQQFKVQSIPHVIFYKNGELQSDISRTCNQIYDVLNKLL